MPVHQAFGNEKGHAVGEERKTPRQQHLAPLPSSRFIRSSALIHAPLEAPIAKRLYNRIQDIRVMHPVVTPIAFRPTHRPHRNVGQGQTPKHRCQKSASRFEPIAQPQSSIRDLINYLPQPNPRTPRSPPQQPPNPNAHESKTCRNNISVP